jgi:hypothetical protein
MNNEEAKNSNDDSDFDENEDFLDRVYRKQLWRSKLSLIPLWDEKAYDDDLEDYKNLGEKAIHDSLFKPDSIIDIIARETGISDPMEQLRESKKEIDKWVEEAYEKQNLVML